MSETPVSQSFKRYWVAGPLLLLRFFSDVVSSVSMQPSGNSRHNLSNSYTFHIR